jgi:hypothetical protein
MTGESGKPNPIGEKYAEMARSFLELHQNRPVDEKTITYLSELLASTTCELVGVAESAEILGVTKQRVAQLNNMPPRAAEVRATPLWLREDVKVFGRNRLDRRKT